MTRHAVGVVVVIVLVVVSIVIVVVDVFAIDFPTLDMHIAYAQL